MYYSYYILNIKFITEISNLLYVCISIFTMLKQSISNSYTYYAMLYLEGEGQDLSSLISTNLICL